MAPPNKTPRPFLAQWLGLCTTLIALGVAVSFNIYLDREDRAAREKDRLASLAKVIADNMAIELASTNRALEAIRDDLPAWQGSPRLQAALRYLGSLASAMPGVQHFSVLDAQGTLVTSSLPERIGVDDGHQDYSQTVKRRPDPHTLYVSAPFKNADDLFVIHVTRMIPGPQGEFSGVVTAALDPRYFKTLMNSVLYAPDMWDGIAHGDGLLFLMVPERKALAGMNLAQPGSFFSRHRDSSQVLTVMSGTVYATKEDRVIAQRTVQPAALRMDKSLIVAVSRDRHVVFQPWRRDALIQGGLFALVVMVSTVGLYVFQRRQRLFDLRASEAAIALRRGAERLQLATEASGVGVWDYDCTTNALVWDDTMYRLYGIAPDTVTNLYEAWYNSLLPEDRPLQDAAWKAAIAQTAPYAPCFRIRRGDGEVRHIQARARLYFGEAGQPIRMVGTNEDITERRREEALLQESEARLRLTFDSAAIGMALVNVEGRFMRVNDALCNIVGYTQDELRQKSFQEITHPDDLGTDLTLMNELLAGTRDHYHMEKRYVHKDGHVIWILLSGSALRDAEGKVLYFIAMVQDISERKRLLGELERQATRDYLTNLSNRRHFLELGEAELAHVKRYGHALSLLMLDIDRFKSINDTHGHKAGDVVLQTLAGVLRDTLRTVDIIGRMGGEEFAVLLPETDLDEAAEVAERLREIVAGTAVMRDAGLPLHFTISIGVVTLKQKDTNLDTLLNVADHALYDAKRAGRNKVCVAT